MLKIPLLDKLDTFLEHDINGLIALILFIFLVIILLIIKKKDLKTPLIKIIIPFMFFVLALLIIFFTYKILDKQDNTSKKEWLIKGSIELQDYNGIVLRKVSKDDCGNFLKKSIPLQQFLNDRLKIIIMPGIVSTSFGSRHFTVNIPSNLGKNNLDILFQIDGFRCNPESPNSCIREVNSSVYSIDLGEMIFVQEKSNKEECASRTEVAIH